MLPTSCVAPPRAYFAFSDNGRMHLPIMDWGSFRGYSVVLWINAEFLLPSNAKSVARDGDDLYAKFNLFRFVNGSSTLGVEASIEFDKDGPNDGRQSVLLNVSSCYPNETKKQSSAASILSAPASGAPYSTDWKRIQHRIQLVPGQWHLLVLSHSLHYVKKSKVTCYVDTKRQFHEELVYPSGLVTASKCTIGGGQNTAVKLASVTMYQEELSSEMIRLLYAQGPMISSFNRWATAPPNQLANHVFGDFHGVTVASSPLSVPYSDLFSAYCKLQVVFCFTAHDVANEDYSGLGVEWLSEGTVVDSAAKWVTMENIAGLSAEIQQRNARLGKNVQKVVFPDSHAAWYRVLGVVGMPVLLHYILTGYEKICTDALQSSTMTSKLKADAADVNLGNTVENMLVDFMWIIKGMLLNRVNNQQEVLQNYVFHVVCHVLVKHQARVRNIWTPRSLLVCVDMIKSMHKMLPSRRKELLNINHPLQESIWVTNPLFASGIRAVLMDYRLWFTTDFKTQSIYNHQLYGLVCEYPRLFNDMQTVPKMLEILRQFYTNSVVGETKTQPAKSKESQKKNDDWKQQCVNTLVEVMEVCLTNQSVFVHGVNEEELLETTFARPTNANAAQGSSGAAPSSTSATYASFVVPRRQGGVFSINLENIVWSDQPDGTEKSPHDDKEHPFPVAPLMTAPSSVQVRFSLIRNIRAIIRFLMTNQDPVVCRSILLLLRRLAVSFLDMRFALVSSNIMDCLLFLMHQSRSTGQGARAQTGDAGAINIRMACIPLFIFLADWLESIEGRTVWCGLEEHLRLILNGEGNFSIGFLELMMEFYFNPPWLLGVQQSIIMNDPSKKDSVLFPISVPTSTSPSIHESGIIVTTDDSISGTSAVNSADISGGINGLTEWIQLASQFGGKRLSLSWEKRVALIKMTAIRNLIASSTGVGVVPSESPSASNDESGLIADIFDEGVSGIISLPLRGVLPFLPILLRKSSPNFREKVLMDINVKLKTDEYAQQQLLLMKREWTEALLELSLVCACQADEFETKSDGTSRNDEHSSEDDSKEYGRAYSFDASKTGEDLVLDTIVSLLCVAMNNTRGWRSFTDLILALKSIRLKYDRPPTADTDAPSLLLSAAERVQQSELYCRSLDWLSRVTGIVLQRMARSRTILSRALAENVQKVLYLVYETLLALPLRQTSSQSTESVSSRPKPSSSALSGWIWSDAQLFLLNAVLDICARLILSTHKQHRIGLLPGLQILQRALPFIAEKAIMERVIEVLVSSFQQEMGIVAALRVYDSIPTREVFLGAMVCLRRALLIQESEEILALLRVLTLRITTSGSFVDELQAAELTVQALGEMTEADASIAALDALALSINETEMHEREEEADLVPHFPVAKELRSSQRRFSLSVQGGDEKESTGDYQSQFVDESERLLWAALEVEENRMMESLRDVAEREKHHIQNTSEILTAQKKEWAEKLWVKQEYTFRSQHQHSAMNSRAPDALRALQQTQIFRIGLYETPHPSRMRRTLDVDLRVQVEKDENVAGNADEGEANRGARRRQFSLPLEVIAGVDGEAAHSPVGSPNARANDLLLERVGRVVAEQGGGEIQDITADSSKDEETNESGDSQTGANDAQKQFGVVNDESKDGGSTDLQLTYDGADMSEEEKTPVPSIESNPVNLSVTNALKPPASYVGFERQYESGLDPGEGVAVSMQDQLVARAVCRRVIPEGVVLGTLYLCNEHVAFEPESTSSPSSISLSGDLKAESTRSPSREADEAAPGLHRCWRWSYYHIVAIYLRRYRLRDSAIEIFLRNGSNHFLDFPFAAKHQRNELVRLLYSFVPRSVPKQWPGRGIPNLGATTKAWQNRQISNFDYLMALNTFAGRSFNDLTQYPVFPWVLSNYEDESLDLSDARNFRDLSKPMGALNPNRLEEYWERYNSFDDPVIPKFLYGSHYSTCAGVVLFFLFRLQPFAELQQRMQGGCFDLPDRLFYSIKETWDMCNSQMSEVKELTPEFYCDGNFLRNVNKFTLGRRHDQHVVNDVQLPKWASTPEEFIRINRAALESELVSQHLHEWIDLIFGFKQRGKAALKANNVFYYLTYYGVVDLDRIEDPFLRESMELQIAHFGQCPMQLFGTPHPKRTTAAFGRRSLAMVSSGATTIGTPAATTGGVASGVLSSPGTPSSAKLAGAGSNGAANVVRPLSLSFQDFSPLAQEKRRNWSPSVDVKPLVQCAIRLTKILPDRIVTVNELGVIDMYNWRLVPKPQPPQQLVQRLSGSGSLGDTWADAFPATPLEPEPGAEGRSTSASKTSPRELNNYALTPGPSDLMSPGIPSEDKIQSSQCPWLLEIVRDDSPFDFIPRIPFHEARESGNMFPVAISSNGRVIISGGGRGGALHLRLLDLDNGQLIGKASVTGHDSFVTCISVDKLTYNSPSTQHDEEELIVSGSKDGTMALWRLSRVKQDLLFRLPRISSAPIMFVIAVSVHILDSSFPVRGMLEWCIIFTVKDKSHLCLNPPRYQQVKLLCSPKYECRAKDSS
uniref:BEACH domain-containing protein n=1 Tax=Globisporangium ultimum (strain ATCC 200006 / CBS 805.95 / DAOM BR144) TaxID=431595 RepID=K3W8L3_GLOUD